MSDWKQRILDTYNAHQKRKSSFVMGVNRAMNDLNAFSRNLNAKAQIVSEVPLKWDVSIGHLRRGITENEISSYMPSGEGPVIFGDEDLVFEGVKRLLEARFSSK